MTIFRYYYNETTPEEKTQLMESLAISSRTTLKTYVDKPDEMRGWQAAAVVKFFKGKGIELDIMELQEEVSPNSNKQPQA
ncbi:MAG: hypothetical protein GY816_08795 [Cytophagales bacterium]|nr:hypothetical protein [Cytophagales bacterium]